MRYYMQMYSLQRRQAHRPKPPYWLGGVLVRIDSQWCLRDALHIQIVEFGTLEVPRDHEESWVVVRVVDDFTDQFKADECRALTVGAESALEASPGQTLKAFAGFKQQVRQHFNDRGFTELTTPTVVTCPGLEPSLEPIAIEAGKGFLPTSPEIHLKRALMRGWTDIYELRTCHRSKEHSSGHRPEFHMLEWYRSFAGLDVLIEDLRQLVSALSKYLGKTGSPPLQLSSFRDFFMQVCDFELEPQSTLQDLAQLASRLGVELGPRDTFDDVFHRIVMEKLEPHLRSMGPVIIRDFPPSQSALAKLNKRGWGERFEFYWNGWEIANAFDEVTELDEQERRWARDVEERRRLGTRELPLDSRFLSDLRHGMPPSAGIALGVERLFMALTDISHIQRLWLFNED